VIHSIALQPVQLSYFTASNPHKQAANRPTVRAEDRDKKKEGQDLALANRLC
jgi:hypothetical protein